MWREQVCGAANVGRVNIYDSKYWDEMFLRQKMLGVANVTGQEILENASEA